MTRHEHLMVRAMEECNEVAQRLSKALVFGMEQIQQDADDKPEENPERLSNRQRVLREYEDLAVVMEMAGLLAVERHHGIVSVHLEGPRFEAKQAKVERYLQRSQRCGTLDVKS